MPVAPLRAFRFAGLSLAAGLVIFTGCSSNGSSSPAVTHPTMISVEPASFLGEVPCASDGVGLKRYVATIVDRNYDAGGAPGDDAMADAEAGADGFAAPSSLPTPCNTGTGFGLVVAGRHYELLIDGYDTADLAPRTIGSREMVPTDRETDPVHTSVLTPRWTAKCTRAIAVDATIVRADECRPFQLDSAERGDLRVAFGRLLGSLRCGSDPGEVDHFDVTVTLTDGTVRQDSVFCTDSAQAQFSDLAAHQRASVYVQAFSEGMTQAFAGATCSGLIEPGVSLEPDCAALSEVGTLRVDLEAALGMLGGHCNKAEIGAVTVTIPGEEPRSIAPPDCLVPFTHGFPPGDAAVVVSASFLGESAEQRSVTCHAEVTPGQFATADCALNTPE